MTLLEISLNSQENTCTKDSFLIKLQPKGSNFINKESLAQVFSCEFCKISKKTFFNRTPPVAASVKSSDVYEIFLFWNWIVQQWNEKLKIEDEVTNTEPVNWNVIESGMAWNNSMFRTFSL